MLSKEEYKQPEMKASRRRAIDQAAQANVWGIVFSTLGRQGSDKVRQHIQVSLTSLALAWTKSYIVSILGRYKELTKI